MMAARPARLMRCAVVSSGGTRAGLQRRIEQLKIDYRDVIVEGKYAPGAGVRDLNGPIAEDV